MNRNALNIPAVISILAAGAMISGGKGADISAVLDRPVEAKGATAVWQEIQAKRRALAGPAFE